MATMMTALTKQEEGGKKNNRNAGKIVLGLFPQSFHEGSEGVGFEF
jgi:hypothetical protein